MKQALLQKLPVHLQDARMLYMAGINLLCIFSSIFGALSSPIEAVRWQCALLAVLLGLIFVRLVGGTPLHRALHYGSIVCVIHVCIVASVSHTIHSTVFAWLSLLCLTQFYVSGYRAGLRWSLVVLLCLLASAGHGWWQAEADRLGFGPGQPPVSLADHLMVALSCLLVPWIYKRRYDQALRAIRQRQQALQAQQQVLEQTVQMREHFVASVSHELRTPMNAIMGLNSLLLEKVQDRPQARKVLEYTRQSADHLMTVINDVLDYSQMNSGRLKAHEEVFDLLATVQTAFEMFRPQVESAVLAYRCEIDPGLPRWVRTDRHRLIQVLVNLLGNAVKFTQEGSVCLQVQRKGEGVAFTVQDTGIGMNARQQQRIFQRFQQGDETIHSRYGGSGLGLTISRGLVKMLGGHMGLHSQPGQGSRFWFWLPLREVPSPQPEGYAAPPSAPAPDRRLRVLVVDDHRVNRLLARQTMLRYWPDSQVDECENGAQALQRLLAGHRYDLVLMDMVMPEMDGIETTRWIRTRADAQLRTMPVLGLTANVSAQDLERFRQAGLDGLMLKPFELTQLRAEVQRLAQEGRFDPDSGTA